VQEAIVGVQETIAFPKTMVSTEANSPVFKFKFTCLTILLKFKRNCRIFRIAWWCTRHGSVNIVPKVALVAQNYVWMY